MSAFDPKRTFVGDTLCHLPALYVTLGDRLNVLPQIDLSVAFCQVIESEIIKYKGVIKAADLHLTDCNLSGPSGQQSAENLLVPLSNPKQRAMDRLGRTFLFDLLCSKAGGPSVRQPNGFDQSGIFATAQFA
jgi:hypothetical protein